MNWFSLLILILKFVLRDLPRIQYEYQKAKQDKRYKDEAQRIDAALGKLIQSNPFDRSKLDQLKELEK